MNPIAKMRLALKWFPIALSLGIQLLVIGVLLVLAVIGCRNPSTPPAVVVLPDVVVNVDAPGFPVAVTLATEASSVTPTH